MKMSRVKVSTEKLESLITQKMGFKKTIPIAGQTYSRKIDIRIFSQLTQIATSAAKFASDIRFLQSTGELSESFAKTLSGLPEL